MTNERHEECMLNPYTTKGISSNLQITSEAAITKLPTEATRIPVSKKQQASYQMPPLIYHDLKNVSNVDEDNDLQISAMKRRVESSSDDNDYSESSGELLIERRQSGNADKKGQENYRYMNNELTMNNEIKKREHSNQEHVTENSKVSHNRHYSNGSTIKKKQSNSDSLNEVKRAETPDATNREQQPAAGSHPVVRVRTIGDLQPISSKVIKEIAEKVKEIVLKDIEKGVTIRTVGTATTVRTSITEVSIQTSPTTTTTPFPQVTTTEKSSTTKNSEVNPVMLQLIEIFKELKNLKEPTTAPTTKAMQDTTVSAVSASPTPILQKVPTLTATQKYPQQKYAPIYNPYSINSSPIHEQMINNAPYAALPYITHLYNRPITLQTNDDQIAPLAIQISKPLKVMNQHVVITTQDPYIKMKQELERQSKKRVEDNFRIPHSDNNNRYGDRITYRNRFTKDRDKPRYYREHKEKVHHPVDSGFSGSLSHYSENVPYTGRLNRHEYSQALSQQSDVGSMDIRNPRARGYSKYDKYEPQKFHYNSERFENWPRNNWKEMKSLSAENSCEQIPARHQVPIVKVKERTRYDDTHFNNFLKSQQKVTDILEKMLANNIKNSAGPQSVETP
ncbi:unnamed protein product [Spodoptera exigua]|nr:unnamed protein product [Spodoptera exigua]